VNAKQQQASDAAQVRALQVALWQAEADRDAAWQTCRELAAALRQLMTFSNHTAPYHDAVEAVALVLWCNHPVSAIGGESAAPGGTRSCRACAALATEVNHEYE
jgi:hypothetical protein